MGARFYTWRAPGYPLVARLSLSVVERIAQEAFRGLSALPRRGAEVGGILLGTAERNDHAVVQILDAVPVICGHYFGPSYVLTQEEKRTFQQVLARWKSLPARSVYAVGYYRSHTRDELFLSDDDLWLMSTCFADPARVALLVKPRISAPSVGGFFFWEGDRIRSAACYAEFPFDAAALGAMEAAAPVAPAEPAPAAPLEAAPAPPAPEPEVAAAPPAATPPIPEEAPPPAPPAAAAPMPEPESAAPPPAPASAPPVLAPQAPQPEPEPLTLPSFLNSLPPRKPNAGPKLEIPWLAIPVCLLLVLLGGWLGTQGANYLIPVEPRIPGGAAYALRLAVTEYGDNLHLKWDRQAPALPQAERGILIIADGDQSRTMELDAAQLRNGSVIYRRANGPVRFRLELYLKGGRTLSEAWEPAPAQPVSSR